MRSSNRAYTLLEMLMIVAILGIAGALVIPAMGSTGVLRIQAAVRTVVSDITVAQSDAVAYQERRAIVFDADSSSYRMVRVPGDTVDPSVNTMYNKDGPDGLYVVDFEDARYGAARITAVEFDGDQTLIFDSLGGPVETASGNTPSAGGTIVIEGQGQTFRLTVEPFTGRVTVADITP